MKQKGFTLIELLVVVAIIGVLAAVGVVAFNGFLSNAKINASKANHKTTVSFVNTQLISSQFDNGRVNLKGRYDETIDSYLINGNRLDTVMSYFVYALRWDIKENPWSQNEIAILYGPRGTLGAVEFHAECINSQPVILIEPLYDDNSNSLKDSINLNEFGVSC